MTDPRWLSVPPESLIMQHGYLLELAVQLKRLGADFKVSPVFVDSIALSFDLFSRDFVILATGNGSSEQEKWHVVVRHKSFGSTGIFRDLIAVPLADPYGQAEIIKAIGRLGPRGYRSPGWQFS